MFEIKKFEGILERIYKKLLTYERISKITTPNEDWTITELVAHLIDSASNNHQRFIRLQIANELVFPGYEAKIWREISRVNNIDYKQLVELWKLFNWYLVEVIKGIEEKVLSNYWLNGEKKYNLEYLVNDYFDHLLWHEDLFDKIAFNARKKT